MEAEAIGWLRSVNVGTAEKHLGRWFFSIPSPLRYDREIFNTEQSRVFVTAWRGTTCNTARQSGTMKRMGVLRRTSLRESINEPQVIWWENDMAQPGHELVFFFFHSRGDREHNRNTDKAKPTRDGRRKWLGSRA